MLCSLAPAQVSVAASGEYKPYPNAQYRLIWESKDDGTVIITGRTKGGGALVLPSEIEGKPVTEIGIYAFARDSTITGTLQIPETVKHIEKNAFQDCSGFDSLILPEGLETIGMEAFIGFKNLTGNLILPNTITSIGHRAFAHCYNLRGTLGADERIGKGVFDVCTGFTGTIWISKDFKVNYNSAFSGSGGTGFEVEEEHPDFSSCSGLLCNETQQVVIACPVGKTGALQPLRLRRGLPGNPGPGPLKRALSAAEPSAERFI